jgi:hypothetical protein
MPAKSPWLNLSDFRPFPCNPRKIEKSVLEKLKNSIRSFSTSVSDDVSDGLFRLADPIIVNEITKHVVGGNQRVTALKELGQTKVHVDDVRYVRIDNVEKEKALNLALNKITGEWDDELLKEFLLDLDKDMIDLAGFDDDELENVLENMQEDDVLTLEALLEEYRPKGSGNTYVVSIITDMQHKDEVDEIIDQVRNISNTQVESSV